MSLHKFMEHYPEIGKGVFIADGAHVIGDVQVKENSSIWYNVVLRGDVNHIRIGEDTNIQDNSVVHVTHGGCPSIIGNRVTVGHSAVIHACTVEDYALIGMGAVVLDGAHIKPYSLVAAGSVVAPGKTFPEGSLIVGSPAKAVRELSAKERSDLEKSAAHYVELAKKYL